MAAYLIAAGGYSFLQKFYNFSLLNFEIQMQIKPMQKIESRGVQLAW